MSQRIIEHEDTPGLVYAIGDVHGCFGKLLRLEANILADAEKRAGDAIVILLGDLVDRGPDSRGVIDRLLAPPRDGLYRMALSGNHEATMASFLLRPAYNHVWMQFGGVETLLSYGIDTSGWASICPKPKLIAQQLEAAIPDEHVRFLRQLPHLMRFGRLVFVHAGIDRTRPIDSQRERNLLWMRPDPYEPEPETGEDYLVVHGHTPDDQVFVSEKRINLDTGAFAGGPLSAARFVDGRLDGLLSSEDRDAVLVSQE